MYLLAQNFVRNSVYDNLIYDLKETEAKLQVPRMRLCFDNPEL